SGRTTRCSSTSSPTGRPTRRCGTGFWWKTLPPSTASRRAPERRRCPSTEDRRRRHDGLSRRRPPSLPLYVGVVEHHRRRSTFRLARSGETVAALATRERRRPMTKEAPWHSKTMALPGASLVGGDERV